VVLLSSGLIAQTPAPPPNPIEVAYSTNSSNDRILKLDFATETSTVVNTDNTKRKRIQSLAVRDDGHQVHLLVCDTDDNSVLFYENAAGAGQPITNEIGFPDGVSLDVAGNAYVVGSSELPGDGEDTDEAVDASGLQVWMIPRGGPRPGGYGTPVPIDQSVPSQKLEDTNLVPFSHGGLGLGDLLVVSRRPPMVFRYPKCKPEDRDCKGFGPRETFIARGSFPRGSKLTGLAFAPNRDLLISTLGGPILRYDASGQRILPDFAAHSDTTRLDIAVGVENGISYAYVTNRSSHEDNVQRFIINPDGTGKPELAVKNKVSRPNGVSLASSQGAPTPAGGCPTGPPACEGVEVMPAPQIELTFDHVLRAGITTARIIEVADNRQALQGSYEVDQNLRLFFPKGSPLEQQLPDVIVPAHLQSFRKGDPVEGVPTLLLAIMETTAVFRRTYEFHYEEEEQLGHQPPCDDPLDPRNETRTFKVGDPRSGRMTVEGPVFTDISSDCGSNIGRGSEFSFFLVGRSLRTPAEIGDGQFDNAFATLDPDFYPCIDGDLRGGLAARLRAARNAWEELKAGDPEARPRVIALLNEFIDFVDQNPGGLAQCTTNVAGDLISRALAILYNVPKVQIRPNLVVQTLTHLPTSPTSADLILFTAVVTNTSGSSAGPSVLEFRVGGETPGDPDARFQVPALGPGQSFTVERRQELPPANYINTATADVDGDVDESNEQDNQRQDSYTVVPFIG
jgi:hypothetical protein